MSASINLFKYSDDFLSYPAGHVILRRGDPGNVMYVVQDGEVNLMLDDTVVETVGPGGVFGEMALIDKRPRNTTAVAKTDCRIVPIDEKRFLFMIEETPNFALDVMRILVGRIRSVMRPPDTP
ncbi:MAG: cyclic nucleotide-binding domain-containing protein [Chloroflexi bacterium]|nr:cyclic nucleotide-binding domain-containing protein [Chloroflexota bacterium]